MISVSKLLPHKQNMNRMHIRWSARAEKPYVLNLSPGFIPLQNHDVNSISFENFTFPSGDPHIKLQLPHNFPIAEVMITHRVNGSHDMIELILATDALRNLGFTDISALIPSLPGARQDRVCVPGEPLTARVMADLINAQGFSEVLTFAPHSDVAPALVRNCRIMDLAPKHVKTIIDHINEPRVWILAPDAGAVKRVSNIVQQVQGMLTRPCTMTIVECGKKRNVHDGKLEGCTVPLSSFEGQPILILDDVVAGGRTFVNLLEALRPLNIGKPYIYTSHADFAMGLDNLRDAGFHVYTTNSKHNFLNVKDAYVFPILL